ncbi:MAG: MoaD/ThiS family protein [Desulfobacteraceae bacterium]|nr:MoaD/ThiS family protein [Desulfobacteraceae bacterium]
MGVEINIHLTHRQHTDNKKSVEVEGKTIGEAINNLCIQYPGLKPDLFDDKGKLLNHIEIYLNSESAYPDELIKNTKDGDIIHITAIFAGG